MSQKKTCRQSNSFYQYSEALCTKVSESHFQQVPLKFFSNFVTLFVTIPCNMGEMINFMIFKKIKVLKKLFRKKPPAKFWQFFMKTIILFWQNFCTMGEMNFSKITWLFSSKIVKILLEVFYEKVFSNLWFFWKS